MSCTVNFQEYSGMIHMNGTRGMYQQTPRPFSLPANGEHSGYYGHADTLSSGQVSWEKLPYLPPKSLYKNL